MYCIYTNLYYTYNIVSYRKSKRSRTMSQNLDHLPEVSDCIMGMLNEYNSGISQEQFYHQNIVDATDVTEEDMGAVNAEVIQFCKENGCYAALPPFEEGSFIDRSERRYTHWKVLEVKDDYFRIELDHYPIIFLDETYHTMIAQGRSAELTHVCWYRACRVIVKVKLLSTEEHMDVLSYHPDFYRFDKNTCSALIFLHGEQQKAICRAYQGFVCGNVCSQVQK